MTRRSAAILGGVALACTGASPAPARTPGVQPDSLPTLFHTIFPLGSKSYHAAAPGVRWTLGAPPWRAVHLSDRPQIAFRDGRARVVSRYRMHETHLEQDTQAGILTIDMARTRASRGSPPNAHPADAFGLWSANAGYLITVSSDDTLRLSASVAAEKRNSSIAIAGRRWITSRTRTSGMEWRHNGQAVLSFGRFQTSGPRTTSMAAREIELAAGSPIAEHGYYGSIGMPLAGSKRGCEPSIRFDLANARLEPADAAALGAVSLRDRRATMSLMVHF